jgi:hypothetical protein
MDGPPNKKVRRRILIAEDSPIHLIFHNSRLLPMSIMIHNNGANDKNIMGKETNGRFTKVVVWAAARIMFAAAFGMFATWK